MPRLIAAIIRHGDYRQLPDTPSAHQPFPLTAEGEAQARKAALALREFTATNHWTISADMDCSRLLRGWQTARIIADELVDLFPQPPVLNEFDALAERCLGSAANLTSSQVEAIVRDDPRYSALPADWKSNSRFRLPLQGAESLLEAGERVANHMTRQMDAMVGHIEHDTLKLFVGHGAAFRHAAYHLGLLAFEDIARLSMYHAVPIYLEYCASNTWRHIGGDWKVRRQHSEYND